MRQITAAQRAAGVVRKLAAVPFHGLRAGQRAFLATVRLGDLIVDESYQRKLSAAHPINGNEFVGIAQGLPDIVWTGRELHTADGQHRIQQLVDQGHHTAPVLLFEGVTYQQEADLYYIKNKQKKRTDTWNAFNAGRNGGRVKEVNLYAAITAEGFTTPLDDNGDPELTSVSVLEEAYRTKRNSTVGGMPLVRKFLRVLRRGWNVNRRQGLQKEARNVQTQRGLLRFIRANWHLSEAQLIAVLRLNDAASVNRTAAVRAGQHGVSRAEANYVTKVLAGLFAAAGHVSRAA